MPPSILRIFDKIKINNFFFFKPRFGVSKINQGFYILELPQENLRKAFVSAIYVEVGVQMFKYQGISVCEIEGFAHVAFFLKT